MKKELKNKLPEWFKEIDKKANLIVGDDSDSLISCNLLKHITGGKWDINYFYDFNNVYCKEESNLPLIGVDMAFNKGMTFDNHLTKRHANDRANPLSVNLNNALNKHRNNYCEKYPFSTLMTIWSLYDIPLPKTIEGKVLLLSIDSSYQGFYTKNEYFKSIHSNWFEELRMTELIDVMNEKERNFFKSVKNYFGINEKVRINEDGKLYTGIELEELQSHFDFKLELPEQEFYLHRQFQRKSHTYTGRKPIDTVSFAFTGKNHISYTVKEA